MRLLALLAAGLFAGAVMADDRKDKPKADEKKVKDEEAIVGTWAVEAADGGALGTLPAAYFQDVRLAFMAGGKFDEVRRERLPSHGEYKLGVKGGLKTIELTPDGRTVPGLYELDGDTLKLCVPLPPKEGGTFTLPAEFKAESKEDGTGTQVLTLKRVKDEKKDEPKKDK